MFSEIDSMSHPSSQNATRLQKEGALGEERKLISYCYFQFSGIWTGIELNFLKYFF